MDESWGYYAKWNKADRKRQILHDLTYMGNLKQNKTKGGRGKVMGKGSQRVQTSSYKMNKFCNKQNMILLFSLSVMSDCLQPHEL